MDAASLATLQAALVSAEAVDVDEYDVWADHWQIVQAFLAVATQWRTVSRGGGFEPSRVVTIGFDYASVRVALEAEDIMVTSDLWRGLRIMESAACAALNEVD